MYDRLLDIDDSYPKSVLLFGPRGTGKTSWLKAKFPDAIYFDLLDTSVFVNLQRNAQNLEQFIPPNYKGWIIIDEIQRLPNLLNEVHRLIESHHYRFLLTGSSARKLRRKGSNLLAGRALRRNMYPLTAYEQGTEFDMTRALNFGQLPAISSEPDLKRYLDTYVGTYLKEEIQQESVVRNLDAFTRFLETASFSQGSTVNMSAIARETSVSQKTIKNYFEILEDLLLARKIPVFTRRAKRELTANPKFYYFDVGVYRRLRPQGPLDTEQETGGIAAKSLFLQELIAINDYFDLEYNVFYWRTKSGTEVDFILYGPNGFKAFEIKSKSYLDKKDLKGLKAFKEDYPEAGCYVIFGGSMRQYFSDISAIPMKEALLKLPNILDNSFDKK